MSFYITYLIHDDNAVVSPIRATSLVLSFHQAAQKVERKWYQTDHYEFAPHHVQVEVMDGSLMRTGGDISRLTKPTRGVVLPFDMEEFEALMMAAQRERFIPDFTSDEKIALLREHHAVREIHTARLNRRGPLG
jgi:hypothetical protein